MAKGKTKVVFWGTRGSIPTPGRSTFRYGGNTACVEVRSGNRVLILDAGTGIRELGRNFPRQTDIPVLIGHTHQDHIGGLPFFAPALERKRRIRIFGPRGLKRRLEQLFPFPVLPARRVVHEIGPGSFRLSGFRVTCRRLNHPGGGFAFEVATGERRIIYISDHEPVNRYRHDGKGATDEALARWIEGADLLIMDAQYFEEEYRKRRGWGHSPVSYTVRIALRGRVKRLALFHHDPAHTDALLEKKLKLAKRIISRSGNRLSCFLAREGQWIRL